MGQKEKEIHSNFNIGSFTRTNSTVVNRPILGEHGVWNGSSCCSIPVVFIEMAGERCARFGSDVSSLQRKLSWPISAEPTSFLSNLHLPLSAVCTPNKNGIPSEERDSLGRTESDLWREEKGRARRTVGKGTPTILFAFSY